ncbi:MAG: SUMF1/EgtB/PvdO family nonheme iron enzyme [Bacteroidales bacterium]|nr:SUMF1/EgtB/PvdO family nonheme iron enzyme [Bacteroidales bacterium]
MSASLKKLISIAGFLIFIYPLSAQDSLTIHSSLLPSKGMQIQSKLVNEETNTFPMFHLMMDGKNISSDSLVGKSKFEDKLEVEVKRKSIYEGFTELILRFHNTTELDIDIENVVPFGNDTTHAFITAEGSKEWPQYLCRSKLYRPGYEPVGVLLPDNAWHLGWASIVLGNDLSLSALARRMTRENAEVDRWRTIIHPGGWIEYAFYFIEHKGGWKEGLEKVFREHFLFDLESFDNQMFKRDDLKWIRNQYLMLLQFAWDDTWYDVSKQKITFDDHFFKYDSLTGGWDIFTLWPTWPRLGLDERNQFDMYRDLPGGIGEVKRQSELLHQLGKKYFISYNPWDESTRKVEHMEGLAQLLQLTDADGVVLDTRGESSKELQTMADSVRSGIIMYSEGMAIPKHMPGIVSGRVHNALFMPPVLNLNKYIKPDFAIFRVIDLAEDAIHREIAVAFFNGYGIEINMMRPGRPDWIEDEFRFMGKTTRILRENTTAFNDPDWRPFIETVHDQVWVNGWCDKNKDIYTLFSLIPEGYNGKLFQVSNSLEKHYVDLVRHEECRLILESDENYVMAELDAFNESWLGTRKEGSIGCIAGFPKRIKAELKENQLSIKAIEGDEIKVWYGNPSYDSKAIILPGGEHNLQINPFVNQKDEKIVFQLFHNGEILDEVIVRRIAAQPLLVSHTERTAYSEMHRKDMCFIPPGDYHWKAFRDSALSESFIPFPAYFQDNHLQVQGYYMDKYPVTNKQYEVFIQSSGYLPIDTTNYLKHWIKGKIPEGIEDHPAVNVSLQDARAYASWAGKRLPTEWEWQYAAQGNENQRYPWGNWMDSTMCNYKLGKTTSVDMYPSSKSPFGVMDLVGNVWQITADQYYNGSYYFSILKGGSFYSPESSIWYVKGGPVPVSHPEMLIHVSPALDRCSTIGFRCVMDAGKTK